MNEPKVSVVLAVYNAEQYLKQCLESLCRQTLKEIEIICVNDGSSDGSGEILGEFARRDPRVRIIEQENAGAGAARNNGIQYIRGTYSLFLDADDFFEPDMLKTVYNEAEHTAADVAVFGCDIYENGKFLPCTYSIRRDLLPTETTFSLTDVSADAFRLFVGWAWDKLIRTELIQKNSLHFQEQRTTNDMLFVFSALLKAERICVKDQVLAHYRREPGSLSVTREKSWHCFYQALLALRSTLQSWGLYKRFERDYLNYCVHFSLWNLNTLCEPTHTLLYNKLREEWYRELGVLQQSAEWFYDKVEYLEFRRVVEHPVDWSPTAVYRGRRLAAMCRMRLGRILTLVRDKGFTYTAMCVWRKLFR